MAFEIEVKGIDELRERVAELSERLYSDEASKLCAAAARSVAAKARGFAPVGNFTRFYKKSGYMHTPGTLKRAITSYALRRTHSLLKWGPAARALVVVKKHKTGASRWAPYAHIVEDGRKTFRPFAGKKFWARAVDGVGPAELDRLAIAYKNLVEKRYGK
jgi:hypothetical protein